MSTIPLDRLRSMKDRHLTTFAQRLSDAGLTRPKQIRPWDEDPVFVPLMARISQRTLVDKKRCHMLWQLARRVAKIPGEVAEIGVYRGGTARLLAEILSPAGKTIHLFDTFEGMPETDPERDLHRAGDFSDNSLAEVKAFLAGAGSLEFHQGFFPATSGPTKDKTFAFVHVDTDIYRSVLDCCEFFYPRLSAGGVMVFDDYGFLSCPGAKAAVDEFFARTQDAPLYLPSAQAVVIKT